MSGQFPTSVTPSRVTLTSITPTFVSVSHSLKRQARTRETQRWRLDVEFPPMTREQAAPILAFAVAQRGQFETFTFVPPPLAQPLGQGGGSPLVNGAGQTGRNIALKSAPANVTGWLKAGDLIKFAGHAKVYMVMSDANTDATGNVTLTIEPALETSPADGEAVTISNVPFQVSFVDDNQAVAFAPPSPDYIVGYRMTLIEVP